MIDWIDDGLSQEEFNEVYFRCYGCGYNFHTNEASAGLVTLCDPCITDGTSTYDAIPFVEWGSG